MIPLAFILLKRSFDKTPAPQGQSVAMTPTRPPPSKVLAKRRTNSATRVIGISVLLILGLSLYGGGRLLLNHGGGMPFINAFQPAGKVAKVGETTIRVNQVRVGLVKVSHPRNSELVWNCHEKNICKWPSSLRMTVEQERFDILDQTIF